MKNRVEHYFADGSQWLASSYSTKQSMAAERLELVKSLAREIRPQSVLDIGCGDGRLLKSMEFIERRVGIDYSVDMLRRAAEDSANDISYKQLDINNLPIDKFHTIGKFDLITMMGLIHYLKEPFLSLSVLCETVKSGGWLAVSFRNRLFNICPKSKYSLSDLTVADYHRLAAESRFWLNFDRDSSPLDEHVSDDEIGGLIVNKIKSNSWYEGITDPEWNIECFEFWRQFTPFEAIVLFNKVGLSAVELYALNCEGVYYQNKDKIISAPCQLPMSTSFVLLGKLQSKSVPVHGQKSATS
ncbi:MAG: class I SAM-dependent methyltransferase [Desulfamplus sp.]|nr:class I SAM-dependent methyltransferase [Desulfamplus sp.]